MSGSIEAIRNLPYERLILRIKTDEGDIKIETTKEGAILLIKLLRMHTRAVKEQGGFDIEIESKKEETKDDDFILEQFKDREELLTSSVKKAIAADRAEDPMYF